MAYKQNSIRELTYNISNWVYYSQLGILSPIEDLKFQIGDLKSPIGDTRELKVEITNWL